MVAVAFAEVELVLKTKKVSQNYLLAAVSIWMAHQRYIDRKW